MRDQPHREMIITKSLWDSPPPRDESALARYQYPEQPLLRPGRYHEAKTLTVQEWTELKRRHEAGEVTVTAWMTKPPFSCKWYDHTESEPQLV